LHVASISSKQPLTIVRSKEKIHINVVVIGHVDSGKSTTTGRKALPAPASLRCSNSQQHRLDLQVRWY
jgi:translation elongation factor EF-Tu-like GTPase